MRFQTIVAPTITELFERQIQGMILSGQVEPGEKLPTEAELAENMHISKSAVHAGIKNLERMGFLRVSPRHGVYIADWAECGNVDTLISILKYRDGKLDKAQRRCCRRATSLRGSRCGCSCPSVRMMTLRCCARSSAISVRLRSGRTRTWTRSRSWRVRSTGISALRAATMSCRSSSMGSMM